MFSTDDTIVAIATPSGRGGIGVIRISGPVADRHRGSIARARLCASAEIRDFRPYEGRSGRGDLLSRSAFLYRQRRRRNQRARQPGRAQADRGGPRSARVRGSRSLESSRFARSSTAGSISSRRKRSPISSTRSRRCRRGRRSINSKARSPSASQRSTPSCSS